MSISSQQADYLTISSSCDTITITPIEPITIGNIDLGNISLDMNSSSAVYINSYDTVTLDPLTIDDLTIYGFGEEWTDQFPDWDKVKDMCDRYPGLQIAFEKFKTVYKLVKDDYDASNNNQ